MAILAVEYHGHGHFQGNATMRDAVKREAYRSASIALVEVPARYESRRDRPPGSRYSRRLREGPAMRSFDCMAHFSSGRLVGTGDDGEMCLRPAFAFKEYAFGRLWSLMIALHASDTPSGPGKGIESRASGCWL